jgi:hypothetical protein
MYPLISAQYELIISAHILEHDCTSYPESPLSHSTISLDQFRLILTALCPHIRRDFPTGHMKSLSCSGYIRSSEKILSAEFFWLSCGNFVVILAIIFADLSAGDAELNFNKLCILIVLLTSNTSGYGPDVFFCQFVVAFIVEKIHVRAHVYHCVAVSISTCHVFLISHNFICSAKILF